MSNNNENESGNGGILYRKKILNEIITGIIGDSRSEYTDSCYLKLVDYDHLVHTITQQQQQQTKSIEYIDGLYRELLARNIESDNVVCCEITRLLPEMAFSFVIEPTKELPIDKFGIIQIILRYINEDGNKITQVMTFKLDATDDINEYLSILDEEIWISFVARDLVGVLHNASDPLQLQLNPSTTNDTFAMMLQGLEGNLFYDNFFYLFFSFNLDISITNEIDSLIKEIIASFWKKTSYSLATQNPLILQNHLEIVNRKISRICRMLFHLREGPLLYGPSAVSLFI